MNYDSIDEQFNELNFSHDDNTEYYDGCAFINGKGDCDCQLKDIKDFIHQIYSQAKAEQKEEIVKKINSLQVYGLIGTGDYLLKKSVIKAIRNQ